MSGRRRIGRLAAPVLVAALVLGAAPAVTGTLVDAAGRPVAHATLTFIVDPGGLFSRVLGPNRLTGAKPKARVLARTHTDGAGRFTLATFPKGGALVVVRRHGRVVGALHVDRRATTLAHLALAKGKTIGGRVTRSGGEPVAGATVTVAAAFFDLPPVGTGTDGRFEATVPGIPMPWIAILRGRGIAAARVMLLPGLGNHLIAGAGRTITGIVRENGRPVAGASVQAGMMDYVVRTTTGKDGRFTLGSVPAGRAAVPMYVRAGLGDAVGHTRLLPGAHPSPLVIDLVAPGTLRVTVLDAAGHPVAGAKVTARRKKAITGRDGVATVTGLMQGALMVTANAPGHGQGMIQMAVNGTVSRGTIRLPPGADLTVHVVGLARRDAATALVAVDRLGKRRIGDYERQVRIGAAGLATVPNLRAGRYVVGLVDSSGPAPMPVRVRIPRRRPVWLRVPRARPVSGRVVDGYGRPVAGVRVVARRVAPGIPAGHQPLVGLVATTTDPRGHFRLRSLGPGRYRVTAGGRGSYPTSRPVTIRAGRHRLVLRVRRGLAITGVVCDSDGNPLASAEVQATRVGIRPGETLSYGKTGHADVDAKGHFVLAPLVPGRYTLDAFVDPAHSARLQVPAGSKDLTLVVDTGG